MNTLQKKVLSILYTHDCQMACAAFWQLLDDQGFERYEMYTTVRTLMLVLEFVQHEEEQTFGVPYYYLTQEGYAALMAEMKDEAVIRKCALEPLYKVNEGTRRDRIRAAYFKQLNQLRRDDRMKDAAFLWSLAIRADDDLILSIPTLKGKHDEAESRK